MTRPRRTYEERVFARPAGYDESHDREATAELVAIAQRRGKTGMHSDDCLAYDGDGVCTGSEPRLLYVPDPMDVDPLLDREVDSFGRAAWR